MTSLRSTALPASVSWCTLGRNSSSQHGSTMTPGGMMGAAVWILLLQAVTGQGMRTPSGMHTLVKRCYHEGEAQAHTCMLAYS